MYNKKSPYKEGDIKWVFLLKGSYPYFEGEYLIQVQFTHCFDDITHEAKVLRGGDVSGGYEMIPVSTSHLRIDQTKIYDTYTEAKNQFIKFLEYKKNKEIKKIELEHQRRLNQFGDWENSPYNKDLIRESKIDSIFNELDDEPNTI